ncbi:hypothetical protein D3C86_2095900 [compost metagenome]
MRLEILPWEKMLGDPQQAESVERGISTRRCVNDSFGLGRNDCRLFLNLCVLIGPLDLFSRPVANGAKLPVRQLE